MWECGNQWAALKQYKQCCHKATNATIQTCFRLSPLVKLARVKEVDWQPTQEDMEILSGVYKAARVFKHKGPLSSQLFHHKEIVTDLDLWPVSLSPSSFTKFINMILLDSLHISSVRKQELPGNQVTQGNKKKKKFRCDATREELQLSPVQLIRADLWGRNVHCGGSGKDDIL